MSLRSALLETGSIVTAQRPWPRTIVTAEGWQRAARAAADGEATMLGLWSDGAAVHLCLGEEPLSEPFVVSFPCSNGCFPSVAQWHAPADRLERSICDLYGMTAEGAPDTRPWLDHGRWGLRHPLGNRTAVPADGQRYDFRAAEGPPMHQIPVGPVHAGIIEPGHFRFSIVGEKVLRLEERLGYVHKGIERRFTELTPADGYRLAGRVSGDSTVAYAWAYCMALESALKCSVPARAVAVRALMLERERVANHLGDLGALGNDAALSFGLAQFSRLREDWLRLSMAAFGHRLMMDCVVPGGVSHDLDTALIVRMHSQCEAVEGELKTLRAIYDEHAGLQDRFIGTGRVAPELARQLGLAGLAGRASGQACDLRCDHAWAPYDTLGVHKAGSTAGDVAARVALRFDEAIEALRLIRSLCTSLPAGELRHDLAAATGAARGAGWVEGWRGEVLVALELADGAIHRCHCHDPSWQNWPVLEHAVMGNIVPDFPLINKSFNLSYSGHDL